MCFDSLNVTLPVMVKGMAGIFIVTAVIVACVMVLSGISNSRSDS